MAGFRSHQDYAYWYGMRNGYPDMATVLIAVDPMTREKGCLEILEGSHKMGRIGPVVHDEVSDSGVWQNCLAVLEMRLPEVYVELKRGEPSLLSGSRTSVGKNNRTGFKQPS